MENEENQTSNSIQNISLNVEREQAESFHHKNSNNRLATHTIDTNSYRPSGRHPQENLSHESFG